MNKKIAILTILFLALFVIGLVCSFKYGERFLTALLIFGAIFLPSIFIIRLITAFYIAIKSQKENKKPPNKLGS